VKEPKHVEIAVLKTRDKDVTTFVKQTATDFETLYFANASPYFNDVEYDVAVTEGAYEHTHSFGRAPLNPVGQYGDISPIVTYRKTYTLTIRKLISHVQPRA
jgi:hypothetical protein